MGVTQQDPSFPLYWGGSGHRRRSHATFFSPPLTGPTWAGAFFFFSSLTPAEGKRSGAPRLFPLGVPPPSSPPPSFFLPPFSKGKLTTLGQAANPAGGKFSVFFPSHFGMKLHRQEHPQFALTGGHSTKSTYRGHPLFPPPPLPPPFK